MRGSPIRRQAFGTPRDRCRPRIASVLRLLASLQFEAQQLKRVSTESESLQGDFLMYASVRLEAMTAMLNSLLSQ